MDALNKLTAQEVAVLRVLLEIPSLDKDYWKKYYSNNIPLLVLGAGVKDATHAQKITDDLAKRTYDILKNNSVQYAKEAEKNASIEKRRKRLLAWHSQKNRTPGIIDLLASDYQKFRYKVARRVNNAKLDFREAIKLATEEELHDLEVTRDELRLKI